MFLFLLACVCAQDISTQELDGERADDLNRQAEELFDQAREHKLKAETVRTEIGRLQLKLIAAAERVRISEENAENTRNQLFLFKNKEEIIIKKLRDEQESLIGVLAALQQISQANPPTIFINPDNIIKAARTAGLLSFIVPTLNERANALKSKLQDLAKLRQLLQRQSEQVKTANDALEKTQIEVKVLIIERQDLEAQILNEAQALSNKAEKIADRVETLKELIVEIRRFAAIEPQLAPRVLNSIISSAKIPVPRKKPPVFDGIVLTQARPIEKGLDGVRFGDMRGRLRPPARGNIKTGVGEVGPDGVKRQGVWFEARSRGQVSAPFDGIVVFSGPFPGLESVLMINTIDGYTLVLGGLGIVYANEGQSVLAGEPVGLMPDGDKKAPLLYFEIKRNTNNSDDPEPWLRAEFRRS